MTDDKKKESPAKAESKQAAKLGEVAFRAQSGYRMPLFYRKAIVWITDSEPFTFVEREIPYESKIHLQRALDQGHIEKA